MIRVESWLIVCWRVQGLRKILTADDTVCEDGCDHGLKDKYAKYSVSLNFAELLFNLSCY